MIFVSTGSRKFQFDRLLKKLDELVAEGLIQDTLFAQIAESSYIPQNYNFERYLSPEEFTEYQEKAEIIITHAGTGALIGALKKGKQVIAVPRLAKFGEHSDDHQTQIAEVLQREGYLRTVLDMENLGKTILECRENPITKRYDKPSRVLPIIESAIDGWFGTEK